MPQRLNFTVFCIVTFFTNALSFAQEHAQGPMVAVVPPGMTVTPVASFSNPWSMAFMPDGRLLVTEALAGIRVVDVKGAVSPILEGSPTYIYDVAIDPDFNSNRWIYYSHSEHTDFDGERLLVSRSKLTETSGVLSLTDTQDIWMQSRISRKRGNFGGRLLFSPDGRYLFITSGDRNMLSAPISLSNNVGKIVRIFPDGSIPPDNPFVGSVWDVPDVWTSGHRNPYGLVWDASGRLWEHEMGPKGGDELNIIREGKSYGWPSRSNGDHYNGRHIPKHYPGDGFEQPIISWSPVIAPAGMIYYTGDVFPAWKGNLVISGLMYHGLVRIELDGEHAREVERISLGVRIREIEQGPDGAIWVLEDRAPSRLLKLTPAGNQVATAPN